MRGASLLLVFFLAFSLAFAAFDDSQATCEGAGYEWFFGDGDYPATYSFTDDAVGSAPSGWSNPGSVINEVVSEFNGHNMVYMIDDDGSTDTVLMSQSWGATHAYGTIEFWVYPENTDTFVFQNRNQYSNVGFILYFEDNKIKRLDGIDLITIADCPIGQWHHVRIDFESTGGGYMGLGTYRWQVYLDDVQYGSYGYITNHDNWDEMIVGITSGNEPTFYLDAVGYSWDPDYDIGDNLVDYYGFGGYCCGDDYILNGYWDDFYNSTHLCYGEVTTNADLSKGYCEARGYEWLSSDASLTVDSFYSVGDNPIDVALGDLDGDGDLDAVNTNEDGYFNVSLNDGSGVFTAGSSYSVESYSGGVVLGDLDGDGDLDVINTNYFSSSFTVSFNDGSGVFTPGPSYSVGEGPSRITLGDLDGDGDLDAVTSNYDGNSFAVSLNDGSGVFTAGSIYTIESFPGGIAGIALGDLDGDGDLDVVNPNYAGSFNVSFNDGSGVFTVGPGYSVGEGPFGIALGDLDGDGDLDAVNTNAGSDSFNISFNDGSGVFTVGPGYPVGANPKGVVLGDLDADGDLDVVNINSNDDSFNISFNDGSGVFTVNPGGNVGDNPLEVTLGDLDGDGDLDVVNTNAGSNSFSTSFNLGLKGSNGPCCGDDGLADDFYNSSHYCYWSNITTDYDFGQGFCEAGGYEWFSSDASFAARVPYTTGDEPAGVALGDFDGDGDLDFVTTDHLSDQVSVFLGVGDGSFILDDSYAAGDSPVSVALGDFDGDGDLDFVTTAEDSSQVSVFLGVGDGSFILDDTYATGANPQSVAVGDFDGDGDLDFVTTDYLSNQVSVFLGVGDGSFILDDSYATGPGGPWGVALGDFDGDSDLDFVTTDYLSNQVSVFLGVGDGSFAARVAYSTGWLPLGVALGDFDGDGDLDFVTTDFDYDQVSVFLGVGDGSFILDDSYATGPGPWGVAVGDFDGDGDLDFVTADYGSNQVSVFLGVGDGSFILDDSYAAGDSPVSVALGDFDGDGDLDFVTTDFGSAQASVFLNLGLNGTFGPCCGDDLIDDNFYNSSHICLDGYVTQEGDTGRTDCESLGYSWFDNSLVGVNGPCCGDDLYYDDFYNGTVSDTEHLCYDGVFYSGFDNGGAGCDGFGFNWVVGVNETFVTGDVDYYGTYSFTDDAIGVPEGWNWDSSYSSVISGQDGHNKVLRFIVGSSYTSNTNVYNTFEEQTSGTVEFWYQYDSYANNWFRFYLRDEYGTNAIECARYTDNHLLCRVQDSYTHFTNIGRNNWYHFRIDFECGGGGYQGLSSDSYHFYLNGEKLLDNVKFYNNVGSIEQLRFRMYNSINNRKSYIDAVGYSWDPYYDVGDNYLASTCCGNDGVDDDFYNATDGYGGFCSDGSYFFGDADGNKVACELIDYEWFSNEGSFGIKTDYSVGSIPRGIDFGDFDNDGYLDIVSANSNGDSVSVLLGNGDGSFGTKTDYAVGSDPHFVALGDLDVDGYLDIVTTNNDDDDVSVLLGNGDGSFGIKTDYAVGRNPYGISLGDFNEDGYLDIVSANLVDNSVSVLLGNGDGSFGIKTDYGTATGPYGIVVGDVNEDGYLDVVLSNYGSDSVSVLLGNGDGSFGTNTDYGTGNAPYGVALGDLDVDGYLDIVSANLVGDSVSVLLGNGDGSFATNTDYGTGNGPFGIIIDDLNSDGYLDILTSNYDGDSVSVLLGNGDGSFATNTDYGTGNSPRGVALGDLDVDGGLDIASVNTADDSVSVLLNIGLNGTNGPCCGDDLSSDDFYNSSRACFDGSGSTDGDVLQDFCEVSGYDWLTGIVTGTNPRCCGDDSVDDDFYNATDGYGGFCSDGSYFFGESDGNEGACSLLDYDWLGGATDPIGNCCGDDGAVDDFGNNTGSCCCNGVVVPSGTECDLDQDGNVDALCENGNLPDVYISSSTYDEGYVTSTYQPEFLIKNTGNETICFTNIEFTNTTMSYTPSTGNPECIEPGNSGLFVFDFGGFRCEDLDQQHDFVVNFTFSRTGGEDDYLVRYISFRVLSPLDIASIEPSIGESLPVPVNDFNNFLLTLSNKGSKVIDYTVDVATEQEVLLLFKTPEGQYSTNELEQEGFKLQPGSSTVYQVKVVALSEGEKSVDISFLNSGPCANISDALTFRVTGFEAGTGLFSFSEVSAWDWLSALLLIVIGCLFLYHNLK